MNITPEESEKVGWDEELIYEYPTPEKVEAADRMQLIAWVRFLVEPTNASQANIIKSIMTKIDLTGPPKKEKTLSKEETSTVRPQIEDLD